MYSKKTIRKFMPHTRAIAKDLRIIDLAVRRIQNRLPLIEACERSEKVLSKQSQLNQEPFCEHQQPDVFLLDIDS